MNYYYTMEVVELAEETPTNTQFTVADLDIEILPIIYEIIRRFASSWHYNLLELNITIL